MDDNQGADELQQRRKLEHEIANDFAVISMGLHCLNGIREEPTQFAEIVEMMARNLESLKTRIDLLMHANPLQDNHPYEEHE